MPGQGWKQLWAAAIAESILQWQNLQMKHFPFDEWRLGPTTTWGHQIHLCAASSFLLASLLYHHGVLAVFCHTVGRIWSLCNFTSSYWFSNTLRIAQNYSIPSSSTSLYTFGNSHCLLLDLPDSDQTCLACADSRMRWHLAPSSLGSLAFWGL